MRTVSCFQHNFMLTVKELPALLQMSSFCHYPQLIKWREMVPPRSELSHIYYTCSTGNQPHPWGARTSQCAVGSILGSLTNGEFILCTNTRRQKFNRPSCRFHFKKLGVQIKALLPHRLQNGSVPIAQLPKHNHAWLAACDSFTAPVVILLLELVWPVTVVMAKRNRNVQSACCLEPPGPSSSISSSFSKTIGALCHVMNPASGLIWAMLHLPPW